MTIIGMLLKKSIRLVEHRVWLKPLIFIRRGKKLTRNDQCKFQTDLMSSFHRKEKAVIKEN
ncbi:hypothetical protein CEF21_19520 [Bacillus sp. FJAT-42376]|nr:hypothetical protein CEF21_19520 [Bacillus sp. FJAT-42376]